TPTPSTNAGLLGISSDRSELLVQGIMANEQEAPLWAVPVLGGTPRRLGTILAHDANWSSDGRELIYANGNALYLAEGDGTEQRRLLELDRYALWPRFSPDGRSIRFTISDIKSTSGPLWEVSHDGSHLHPLFSGSDPRYAFCGHWTTDGRYFVFQGGAESTSHVWSSNIWA